MIPANDSVDIENLHPTLIDYVHRLEAHLGEYVVVTSGYRSPSHPIEARKEKPGVHSRGLAIDFASVGGTATLNRVRAAIDAGFQRIGISRKNNFIHVDIADIIEGKVKSIWTY